MQRHEGMEAGLVVGGCRHKSREVARQNQCDPSSLRGILPLPNNVLRVGPASTPHMLSYSNPPPASSQRL
jgi:hypothetical protein